VKTLRKDEWQVEGELVLKEEKVYILKDEKLRVVTFYVLTLSVPTHR